MANKKKTSAPAKKGKPEKSEAVSFGYQAGPAMVVEKAYLQTGRSMGEVEESQMFGKPCFKVNGKAFMSLFDNYVVFKLTGKAHEMAMRLAGSKAFDPSGKGRAMKEWVQVTAANKAKFSELAKEAMNYVNASTE